MMISFIIPAYNEEKYLPATLVALFASAKAVGEPFEVIVSDDKVLELWYGDHTGIAR